MRGNRRLTVTLVGQLFEILVLLGDFGADWYHVAAIATITVISLIGYNVEDWFKASSSIRAVGEALIEVAKEIDDVGAGTRPPEAR